MISVADIQPNDYNPNVVPEKIMGHLNRNIKKEGIKAPLLVRPPDRTTPEEKDLTIPYIIVDGEHRWINAKDLGLSEVPCDVKKDMTRKEAMVETINMNRLRGEFDSLKLAEVLKMLKEEYTPEELEEKLGYTEIELKSFDDLLEFDPAAFNMDPDALNKIIEAGENGELMLNEFTVSCSLKQLEIIEAAIKIGEEVKGDKASALENVCKTYLEDNAPDELDAINDRLKKMTIKEANEEISL